MSIGDKSALEIADEFQRGGLDSLSLHAQEVVDLADEDDQGDARGKSADDSRGDEGDEAPQPQQPDDKQGDAREQARSPDALQAVACDQHDQHRGHGARRSADLVGRARKQAHDNARQNGGDQPRGSGSARGYAKGQRQRQGHRGHGQAGQQILLEFGK